MSAAWAMRHWPECGSRKSRKVKRQVSMQAASTTIGDHTVEPRPRGGVRCVNCQLYAATITSMRSLRQTRCRGNLAAQCHRSHLLRHLEGIIYCRNCGAYATKRPTALKKECRRSPPNEARRNVLRRLRMGLLPTTAKYLWELAEEQEKQTRIDGWTSAAGTRCPTACSSTDARDPCPPPAAAPAPTVHRHVHHPPDDAAFLPVQRVSLGSSGHDEAGHHSHADGGREARRREHIGQGDGDARLSPSADGQRQVVRQSSVRRRAAHNSAAQGGSNAPINHAAERPGEHLAPEGIDTTAEAESTNHQWCKPSAACRSSWTQRLQLTPNSRGGQCHICEAPARATCRGCDRNVCLNCAKGKRDCVVMAK